MSDLIRKFKVHFFFSLLKFKSIFRIVDLSMIMNTMSKYINGEDRTAIFRAILEKLKTSQILLELHERSIKSTLELNEKWIMANYYDIAIFFKLMDPTTTQAPTTITTTQAPTTITTTQDPTTISNPTTTSPPTNPSIPTTTKGNIK